MGRVAAIRSMAIHYGEQRHAINAAGVMNNVKRYESPLLIQNFCFEVEPITRNLKIRIYTVQLN